MMIIVGDELMQLVELTPHKTYFTINIGRQGAIPFGLAALAWAISSVRSRISLCHYSARLLLDPRVMVERRAAGESDRTRRCKHLAWGSIVFSLIAFMSAVNLLGRPHLPMVRFLSVGQGDATLIGNGLGEYALFDVGPPHAGIQIARRLKLRGAHQLDWVAISHLHPDHYGGLYHLLDELRVGQVIFHGRHSISTSSSRSTWSELTSLLKRRNIPLVVAREGQHRWGQLQLNWLLSHPAQHLGENDASLALLITGESRRALLSGDLESAGEARLRRAWVKGKHVNQPLSVWQTNHHGSSTSTLPETLKLLKPRWMVLSLEGTHRFGFPHPQTLRRIAHQRSSWVRLDLVGDFQINLSW